MIASMNNLFVITAVKICHGAIPVKCLHKLVVLITELVNVVKVYTIVYIPAIKKGLPFGNPFFL